jgi:hypothetical protein
VWLGDVDATSEVEAIEIDAEQFAGRQSVRGG